MADTAEERSYIAFISYRHTPLDREAATRVQKKIESYIVPKEFREQVGGKKLGLCFRDEDELPASSSLTDSIYYALDHTKFLIVICTPNLPLSKWCEAEIRYFLKTHDRDHILAVLADGDPEESFSPYMLHDFDDEGSILRDWEPLAANIAGENHTISSKAFKKEIVRIYAALIGCPFDSLWQRERRARTNRLLSLAGAGIAVLAVFLGVVLNRNARIEEQNTRIIAQNDQITQQMGQIQEQNTKIEEQNVSLQTQLSAVLVDSGLTKLKEHDIRGALLDGINALESEDPDIYDPRASRLLSDTLYAYKYERVQSSIVYEQAQPISDLAVTDDEAFAIIKDTGGTLNCIDLENYELQWSLTTGDKNTVLYTENLKDRIIYKSSDHVCCHSLKDGALLWSYEYQERCENYFQAVSGDGTIFAVIDRFGKNSYGPDNPPYLVFLNAEDGEELGRVELSEENVSYDSFSPTLYQPLDFAGAFSEDNGSFVCIIPAEKAEGEDETNIDAIYRIDLKTFEKTKVGYFGGRLNMIYGVDIDRKDQSIFLAAYSSSMGGVFSALCKEGKEGYDFETLLTDHDLRTPTGVGIDDQSYLSNDCHFLSNGTVCLVFSDDDMMVFDRAENRLMRSFAMNDTVTNAFWSDSSKQSYEVDMADGSIMGYDLGTDYMFENIYVQEDYDQSGIICSQRLNGGLLRNEGSGMYLTAGGEDQNRVLLVKLVSDPHFKEYSFPEITDYSYTRRIFFLPDSDTVLRIYNSSSAFSFDRTTGKVLKTAEFDESFTVDQYLFPLDEDHFLCQDKKYSMDGTVEEYGEPFFEENFSPAYPLNHVRMEDGSIFSWNKYDAYDLAVQYSSAEYQNLFGPVPALCLAWKDGVPLEATADPEHTLTLHSEGYSDNNPVTAGACGQIFAYGRRVTTKNRFLITDPVSRFYFFDPFEEKITPIDNPYPDSGEFRVSRGNRYPWAAVLYDDGKLCIFSAETASCFEVDGSYGAGEVTAVNFSEDDTFLAVLTENGRLDLYDTSTWQQVFSRTIDLYRYYNSVYEWTFTDLSLEYSSDHSKLLVMADYLADKYCAVIDLSSWVVEAEPEKVIAYDANTNELYFTGEGPGVRSTSLYGTEDLKKWAEEVLEK